jgi:hypothetical protein
MSQTYGELLLAGAPGLATDLWLKLSDVVVTALPPNTSRYEPHTRGVCRR